MSYLNSDCLSKCPFCGEQPRLYNGYDEQSGWGNETKGYVECGCGVSVGAPSPSVMFPPLKIAQVVEIWNTRVKEVVV
jgi:hypothetical protein